MQEEDIKIKKADDLGQSNHDVLRRCANRVSGFLLDYAPCDHADMGSDPAGASFTSRALPRFLNMLDEDRRALQDAMANLRSFAERCFPKNEELEKLKQEPSPLPLLRAVLRLIDALPGAGKGARDGAWEGHGGDRRGGHGGGSMPRQKRQRGRKLPPPAPPPREDDAPGGDAKEDGSLSDGYSRSPSRSL